MGRKTWFMAVLVLLVFAGCKDADTAAKWVGTYSGTSDGVHGNTFNQLIVEESNNYTIRISADTVLPGGVATYTYATIKNVTVHDAATGSFNELDTVLGFTHPLQLSGTVSLSGNTITLSGIGLSAYDTIGYYFYGTKQ